MTIKAPLGKLYDWGGTNVRQRWDYATDEHTLAEIVAAGSSYFYSYADRLESGDLIMLRDAESEEFTLRISHTNTRTRTVEFCVAETKNYTAAVGDADPDLFIRFRGVRGGWCVMNKAGDVIQGDIVHKQDALDRLREHLSREVEVAA